MCKKNSKKRKSSVRAIREQNSSPPPSPLRYDIYFPPSATGALASPTPPTSGIIYISPFGDSGALASPTPPTLR